MRKMILATMLAVVFAAAASAAYAACMMGPDYTTGNSLDPNGRAVYVVSNPTTFQTATVVPRVSLDSNSKWLVSDITTHNVYAPIAGVKTNPRLYCFDSSSRFCARSY